MSVCFLTTGPIEWASARFRAFWVAEYMEDATAIEAHKAKEIPDVDAYIFQKAINIDLVRHLKAQGKRIFWDVCDPMHWFSPQASREMCELVDGIVASNEGLAADLAEWSGREVHTIPDRLKLSHYDKQRVHEDVDPVRFIWFGAAQNRASLLPAYIVLERLGVNGYNVELTILDDRPDMDLQFGPSCPVYMTRWRLDNEVQTIANHDIALLPPYPGEWGKVKSNNKWLTAWACGLPVTDGLCYEGVTAMMNWAWRDMHEYEDSLSGYSIEHSAADWAKVLDGTF